MSDIDVKKLRELHAAADDMIELQYTGNSYSEHRDPTKESKAFYEAAHAAIPALLDEVERLRRLETSTVQDAEQQLAAANAEVERLRLRLAIECGTVEQVMDTQRSESAYDAQRLAAMTSARDEACDLFFTTPEQIAAGFDPAARIASLRKVGRV